MIKNIKGKVILEYKWFKAEKATAKALGLKFECSLKNAKENSVAGAEAT